MIAGSDRFVIDAPDSERSPFTGMTRRHWVEAARFLLTGAFKHIHDPDEPLLFPPLDGVGAYGRERSPLQHKAEAFEGLARTFFLGSALIRENPEAKVAGISVREYYARQISLATNPAHPNYIGQPNQLPAVSENPAPGQATVESAALVIGLLHAGDAFWHAFPDAEQEQILNVLGAWGHTRTGHNNWHFFNVWILSFLKSKGVAIDEDRLENHLHILLAWYAGDGWYRDGGNFSNYSPWAFQFYGALWAFWFGEKHWPGIAGVLRARHAEMMKTLPRFFGREGQSLLWTRSAPYRFAASSVLATAWMWREPTSDNPGWMRRIASGNLMQFLGRADVFEDGIPTLGFYGRFAPVVEGYLTRASVFWCGKFATALLLPADHAFWTAKENEGVWTKPAVSHPVVLPGPGLLVRNDPHEGGTEIRPGKVPTPGPGDLRLVFHSHFPWESADDDGLRSQMYHLHREGTGSQWATPNRIKFHGFRDDVLYRMLVFEGERPVIDLAEILIPGGIIRVDRVRLGFGGRVCLTHYGLPIHSNPPEILIDHPDSPRISVTCGTKQLTMHGLHGWALADAARRTTCNPEGGPSILPCLKTTLPSQSANCQLLISVLQHRADSQRPIHPEPVTSWKVIPLAKSGSPLGCELTLHDGRHLTVDFGTIEGSLLE